MFKQKYVVLVCLAVAVTVVALPAAVFAVDKASKEAILQELSGAVDKNPEILRGVIYSLADAYSREGDGKVDEQIALFEKALKIMPDNEDFLSRLGDLHSRKNDFVKAAEIYKKIAELRPDNIWYSQRLSDAYRNAGDNDAAGAVWAALTKNSDNAEVFMQAANFYSGAEDMDKAIEAVKKATELAPDNTGYLQNLESFYMRAEKFSEAEAVCKKVLASAQDQWAKDWANSEIIGIYQRQDKLAELTANFESDLKAAPKDISQYRKLADLYQRNDERDKAIEVYEKAAAAGVADRDIDNRLLDLYEWSEKFDKAEMQIKKIIAASPEGENVYLYERLASMLGRADKKDAAKKAWGEYLAKVPNDAGAVSRFGDRLNEWGELDQAIAQYRKAQAMDAKNLWYTMRVADILIAAGKVGEAKKELNSIVAKATDEWMKQDAERKLADLSGKKAVEAAMEATAVPAVAMPEVKAPAASEAKEEAKAEEPKPKKDKKGRWPWSR